MGLCKSKANNKIDEQPSYQNIDSDNDNTVSIPKSIGNEFDINIFGIIVVGYIREILNKYNLLTTSSSSSNIINELCTMYFGCIHSDLIIKEGQIFRLNDLETKIFEYNSILIKKNATLTLNRYNKKANTGGILNIICNGNIILEEGAKISMTGRGYLGGAYGRYGESYNNKYSNNNNKNNCKTRKSNFGGGGGGQISVFSEYGPQSSCGGGGGYGTNGYDGKLIYDINKENENEYYENIILINDNVEYGIGGNIYGNKYLKKLHLGSGGGSGYYFDQMDNSLKSNKGGAGGGGIKMECFGNIIMNSHSEILCNGNKGKGLMAGGGSGGSIHIIVNNKNNLQMNKCSKIEAIGGININNMGNGGDGRIRIQFLSNDNNRNNVYYHNITPKPYIG
eukprot:250971_1